MAYKDHAMAYKVYCFICHCVVFISHCVVHEKRAAGVTHSLPFAPLSIAAVLSNTDERLSSLTRGEQAAQGVLSRRSRAAASQLSVPVAAVG